MATSPQPSLFLLAGPNGAGKSTLYNDRIKPMTRAPFVNADDIARNWKPWGAEMQVYAASQEAAARRQRLIDARRTFVTETVFSHSSKLELVEIALAAGYRVVLYHVNVRHAGMSVARVNARVATGGHAVPEQKILERYQRNQAIIRRAADMASVTMVFDNSKAGQPPRWLFTLHHGQVAEKTADVVPDWAERLYFNTQQR